MNIEIKTYTSYDLDYKKKLCDLVVNIINYRKLKKYILSSFDIEIVEYLESKGIKCIFICMDYIDNNYLKIINVVNYKENQKNIVGAYNVENTNTNLKYLIKDC